MLGRFGTAVIAAAGFCLMANQVLAQFPPATDPSKGEQKCESSVGKTLSKFVSSKAKCVSKCIGTGRKTSGPYAGCFPPYSDPTTGACVNDPTKGAEAKARASIVKSCQDQPGKDNCPECYAPSNCTTGNPFVSNTETQVDPFVILIYCTEANTNTPTKDQAKCEDGVSKALTKFVGSKTKCYDKCNQNMNKGKIAPGSCNPPNPADPATFACVKDPVKGAEAKAAAAIDKVCANVPGATPSCYGTSLDQGSEWVNLTETQIDNTTPMVACGSPSGAFVD
jgi:hypothetical protein